MLNEKAVRRTNFTCFHAGPKEGWTQYRLEPPEFLDAGQGQVVPADLWVLRVWRCR